MTFKLTNLSFASQDNVILDDNILVNITLNFVITKMILIKLSLY